jgi:prepilin-type processing-associated H-X9-DG protein
VQNGAFGTFQAVTHFRHLPGANMAFLDGHVDTVTPAAVAPDPSWPAGAASFMQANKLGFPSDVNFPYTGRP